MPYVFFANRKKWRLFKAFVLGISVPVLVILAVAVYGFFYDPLKGGQSLFYPDRFADAIEAINASDETQAIESGTFLSVDTSYSQPYIRRTGEYDKRVILTFDDGPDPQFTGKILDRLAANGVPATFFMVASRMEKYPEIVRRTLIEGHDVGLHTYSHSENRADGKLSKLSFVKEIDYSQKVFAAIAGYKTGIFRIPFMGPGDRYSYDSLQYIREALKRGYVISAPTVDSLDWDTKHPETVYVNSIKRGVMTAIILFHDSGGDREATIKALPEIIAYYRQNGYTFMTVSAYAGELGYAAAAQMTGKDRVLIPFVTGLTDLFFRRLPSWETRSMLLGFVFVFVHSAIIYGLAFFYYLKKKKLRKDTVFLRQPFVSIIIPIHNEEKVITPCILSLLRTTYHRKEIIVIDDGSTDGSLLRLRRYAGKGSVKIISQVNEGKAAAISRGIAVARGSIIVTVDADTVVIPGAIEHLVALFSDRKVGTVSGNVRIGNFRGLLPKLQMIEYTQAQAIEKAVMDLGGAVTITPGAFGAWRKAAIKKAGGITADTLAEDFDLTLKVISAGYESRYAERAVAYTEAPETVSQLVRQRLRWYYGNLQVLSKHRQMVLAKKFGFLGLFVLPRMVFFLIPFQIAGLLVESLLLLSLIFGYGQPLLPFVLLYLVWQVVITYIAYYFEGRVRPPVFRIILMRILYMPFLQYLYLRSALRALKGEYVTWQHMKHTGTAYPVLGYSNN